MNPFLTAALYKFVDLPNYVELKAPLTDCCEANQVKGTLILAHEGINGTIAGPPEGVYAVLNFLRSEPNLSDLTYKESYSENPPFRRLKVRVKKEIVTMGVLDIDPTTMAGNYVKPEEWNSLLDDPNVIVVDVRNDFEITVGTFKGALNPQTKSFTELPEWVQQESEQLRQKSKVAMFCTGGIRCEKSTALLRSQGFEEVYHLEGGILKYLETVPESESRWEGECFVFDERVTVGHGLKPGRFELCRGCRHPISPEEKESPFFVPGVSCSHCHSEKTEAQQRSFAERQRQIELARSRNQVHLGVNHRSQKRAMTPDTHNLEESAYPILYSFRRCPYAMRARLALSVSGQRCELREVVLRDKPQEMLELSAKGTVPVLVDLDGRVLEESLDIMRWALERHDPEQWLAPEEGSLEAMLSLIALFDKRFKFHLDRYKYPGRYVQENAETYVKEHQADGADYLNQLNTQSRPYLFGNRVALADLAIMPFVRQFEQTDPTWFSQQPWPDLQNWLATLVNSKRFERCMQKYPKWTSRSPGVLFPPLAEV